MAGTTWRTRRRADSTMAYSKLLPDFRDARSQDRAAPSGLFCIRAFRSGSPWMLVAYAPL
jgi:hypothetical protein